MPPMSRSDAIPALIVGMVLAVGVSACLAVLNHHYATARVLATVLSVGGLILGVALIIEGIRGIISGDP